MLSRQTTGWVGFDLGATSVKAAQAVRTDAGCRIRAAAIVPRFERWPSTAFGNEQPPSSADEISAAASLCEHLAGANAATLLPVAACELLHLETPAAKRAGEAPDLLRAIEVETQRPMRNRIYDHWPMPGHAGKLNVVTAPRAWSDRIGADVAAAGWNCRVIDALPWALARAASLANRSTTGRPIAALDWAYGRSTVSLVHNGVPVLVRSLKECAYREAVEAVAGGLRLSEPDAESLLRRSGQNRAATVIEDLLEPVLNQLAQELRRTLDYWRGVTRGQSPEAMLVFGGGGALGGVGRRLSELVDIPVAPFDLPIDALDDVVPPPACLFGAAVGLSALAWEAP